MKYEIPRGHLSASAIGTLLRCPRQYEFRYVKGVIIPPGKTLATGSIFHKTTHTAADKRVVHVRHG